MQVWAFKLCPAPRLHLNYNLLLFYPKHPLQLFLIHDTKANVKYLHLFKGKLSFEMLMKIQIK